MSRVPIPDRDPRRPKTNKLSTFRGKPMPNLKVGEVTCPVCDQPGLKLSADGKPGDQYQHAGRLFICRDLGAIHA